MYAARGASAFNAVARACSVGSSTDSHPGTAGTERSRNQSWTVRAFGVLARRFFAASEGAALTRIPAERRPEAFTLLWTIKEAVLKARGLGLNDRLDSVTVRLDEALAPESVEAPGGPWSVRAWAPEPGLRAALVVRAGTMPAISVSRAAPLGAPVPAPELGPPPSR